jgi:hypothetical protein
MATSTPLYHALNSHRQEIRILTLTPGKDTEVVHCDLNTASLVDMPAYTALSYVWGGAHQDLSICERDIRFPVTGNLALALRSMRKADREEVLWVDAVCINQDDVIEKQHQIRLMGRVYSDAENVIIWLGKGTPDTDELARIMNETDFLYCPQPDVEESSDAREAYTAQAWEVKFLILIILRKPWWQRVWRETLYRNCKKT